MDANADCATGGKGRMIKTLCKAVGVFFLLTILLAAFFTNEYTGKWLLIPLGGAVVYFFYACNRDCVRPFYQSDAERWRKKLESPAFAPLLQHVRTLHPAFIRLQMRALSQPSQPINQLYPQQPAKQTLTPLIELRDAYGKPLVRMDWPMVGRDARDNLIGMGYVADWLNHQLQPDMPYKSKEITDGVGGGGYGYRQSNVYSASFTPSGNMVVSSIGDDVSDPPVVGYWIWPQRIPERKKT